MAAYPVLLPLWKSLVNRCPQLAVTHTRFTRCSEYELISCDHIGLRTVSHPLVDISALKKLFGQLGYKSAQQYTDADNGQRSIVLVPNSTNAASNSDLPRLCIEELCLDRLCASNQQILSKRVEDLCGDTPLSWDFFSPNHQNTVDLDSSVFCQLLEESSYAAWLYVNGLSATHFSFLVQSSQKLTHGSSDETTDEASGYLQNQLGSCIFQGSSPTRHYVGLEGNRLQVNFLDSHSTMVPLCYYGLTFLRNNPLALTINSSSRSNRNGYPPFASGGETEQDAQIISRMSGACLAMRPKLILLGSSSSGS